MSYRDRYDEMRRMRDQGISYFKIGLHFGMTGHAALEIMSGERPERKGASRPAFSAPVRIVFAESPAVRSADPERSLLESFECPCGRCRAMKPGLRRNLAAIIPKK